MKCNEFVLNTYTIVTNYGKATNFINGESQLALQAETTSTKPTVYAYQKQMDPLPQCNITGLAASHSGTVAPNYK